MQLPLRPIRQVDEEVEEVINPMGVLQSAPAGLALDTLGNLRQTNAQQTCLAQLLIRDSGASLGGCLASRPARVQRPARTLLCGPLVIFDCLPGCARLPRGSRVHYFFFDSIKAVGSPQADRDGWPGAGCPTQASFAWVGFHAGLA